MMKIEINVIKYLKNNLWVVAKTYAISFFVYSELY